MICGECGCDIPRNGNDAMNHECDCHNGHIHSDNCFCAEVW